jgi:hypothetical protein
MKTTSVPGCTALRYSINPKDTKIATFCDNQHLQCITLSVTTATSTTAGGAVVIDNALVIIISQLTNKFSCQNKETMELNNLCHQEIKWQIKQEEEKKDRTKKLHWTIVNMLKQAASTDQNDKDKEIAPTCLRFINSDNVSLAQYNLIHQFKECRILDVTFALGTTQALYLGGFLYADSSSPNNFMVFSFHEQEPNSPNQKQTNSFSI